MKAGQVDLYDLRVGDRVRTIGGAIGEIVVETEDGQWIALQYVESSLQPELVGTADLCHLDELSELVKTTSSA